MQSSGRVPEQASLQIDIRRVIGRLPRGFERLVTFSLNENIRNMKMLLSEWTSGEQRFDRDDAALFSAFVADELVGIAGTTLEQSMDSKAMRMRRMYVCPDFRRCGVASALADACMKHGLQSCHILTCNARASIAAGPFWEAKGFEQVTLPRLPTSTTRLLRKRVGVPSSQREGHTRISPDRPTGQSECLTGLQPAACKASNQSKDSPAQQVGGAAGSGVRTADRYRPASSSPVGSP